MLALSLLAGALACRRNTPAQTSAAGQVATDPREEDNSAAIKEIFARDRVERGIAKDAQGRCLSPGNSVHCIALSLRRHTRANLVRLKAAAHHDGWEINGVEWAAPGEDTVTAFLSAVQLRAVYDAGLAHRPVTAASSYDWDCEPFLVGGRIPRRLAPFLKSIEMGNQDCEEDAMNRYP
ncbi:MAG TPA: hypothetical protein VHU40_15605 [Polyangia bacterium]|nr:hypothetical protein [Polyangia bacterium]